MAEKLRFQKGFRDGGAVDLHEGPLPALAVEMDGPGEHLLAGPRFAGDEDRGLRGGDLGHGFQEPHHDRGAADEVPTVEAGTQALFQQGVFLLEAAVFHGPFHLETQFVEVQGLLQIVVGPFLDGLHGGFQGGVGGHDDDRDGWIDGLDLHQGLQPGDLEHPDVHEDQVEGSLPDGGNGRLPVVGLPDQVSPPGKQGLQHGAMGPVVVHHEDSVFFRHQQSLLKISNELSCLSNTHA